ncbi:uncharacterized protein EI90DRAFT_3291886 [Cantharellus anzutake]|uniref:uncharacterized protein n=1 Tax=Cantharellus anzutake TaxID=1750568 RepID=UPI001907D0E8|nr:uncharacterized protein EI90DRAFT_3291886 [Cantharellus anzutake]KAF8325068.1 hypothetical protein EI90DRAFT_3291886 [Cantharellus anzutake]
MASQWNRVKRNGRFRNQKAASIVNEFITAKLTPRKHKFLWTAPISVSGSEKARRKLLADAGIAKVAENRRERQIKELKYTAKIEALKANGQETQRQPSRSWQPKPQLNAYRLQDALVPLSSRIPNQDDKVRELVLAIEHRRGREMEDAGDSEMMTADQHNPTE